MYCYNSIENCLKSCTKFQTRCSLCPPWAQTRFSGFHLKCMYCGQSTSLRRPYIAQHTVAIPYISLTTYWHNLNSCYFGVTQKYPVDYSVWGALRQRVYYRWKFYTVEELKRAITAERQKLSERFINKSIHQWRGRLELFLQARVSDDKAHGGHTEQCETLYNLLDNFGTPLSNVWFRITKT